MGGDILSYATNFRISEESPISDYCNITVSLQEATCHDNRILDNVKHRKSNQISYKCEESNKEMYVKNITSIHSKNQVANLSELLRCGTNINLLEKGYVILNRIILEAVEPCKMSHRNTEHREDRILSTPHNKRLASPWYDDECHKLRKDYNK